ncbi:MAG: MarR family winged helix-turn-helix transcriptional regulator [Methyloligellaceae bacterium]
MANSKKLEVVTRLIRAAFHRLGTTADVLHAEKGVTGGMRAVMETLVEKGPQTVPQIARDKMVSRQHIQTLADQLLASGLAAAEPNPRHKRSSLMTLTRKGRDLFRAMREPEKKLFAEIASKLDGDGLEATRATLQRLNDILETRLEKGK